MSHGSLDHARSNYSFASLEQLNPNQFDFQEKSSYRGSLKQTKGSGKNKKDQQKGHRKKCPVNEQDEAKYKIDIDNIIEGKDNRTTLMIQNIPNKYTGKRLTSEINKTSRDRYDFFYLPIDFKNQCNMGYAFINFVHRAYILDFYYTFDSKKWPSYNSVKV